MLLLSFNSSVYKVCGACPRWKIKILIFHLFWRAKMKLGGAGPIYNRPPWKELPDSPMDLTLFSATNITTIHLYKMAYVLTSRHYFTCFAAELNWFQNLTCSKFMCKLMNSNYSCYLGWCLLSVLRMIWAWLCLHQLMKKMLLKILLLFSVIVRLHEAWDDVNWHREDNCAVVLRGYSVQCLKVPQLK